MNSVQHYLELLPQALEWLQLVEKNCLTQGRELTPQEMQDAISVGVSHPEKIRLLTVQGVARPVDPTLLQAAIETGMLGDNAAARTIGYGIEIVSGCATRRVLRHEFRHVYQYEQAGSLERFISAYIESVLTDGYSNSEFESDARAHETPVSSQR